MRTEFFEISRFATKDMFFNVCKNQSIINPPPNSPSKGGIKKIVDFFPRAAHTQMDKIDFIFKRKFCGARFPLWRGIKGEDTTNPSFTVSYLCDFTFQCHFNLCLFKLVMARNLIFFTFSSISI